MTSRRGIRSSCYRHYHQLLRHTFCSFIQTVFPRKCPFHDLLTRADRESNVLWEESRYGLSFLRSLSSYSFLYQTPFHDDQRTEVGGDVKETRMLCLIVWTNFSSMGIISWLDISFFGESEVRTDSQWNVEEKRWQPFMMKTLMIEALKCLSFCPTFLHCWQISFVSTDVFFGRLFFVDFVLSRQTLTQSDRIRIDLRESMESEGRNRVCNRADQRRILQESLPWDDTTGFCKTTFKESKATTIAFSHITDLNHKIERYTTDLPFQAGK